MVGEPFEVPPVGHGFGATLFALIPGGSRLSAAGRALVLVVAAGLAVLLAAQWQPWGFIFLGAVTGALGAFGVPTVQAGLRPLFDIGRAALPLVFPLLVFAAAGVINESFAIKFIVGLATLIVWAWLIRPDGRALNDLLDTRKTGKKRRRVLRMWLPGLFVGVALLFVIVSVGQFVAGGGDVSNAAFVIGVGIVAAAAVMRLLSFASNTLRTLVALALLVLLWRLAVEIGLFQRTLIGDADIGDVAIVVGVLLGLTALVEVATALMMSDAPTDSLRFRIAIGVETPLIAGPVTDTAALAGTALATLAAIFMAFAVYDASVSGSKEESGHHIAAPRESAPATPPVQMTDAQLAQTFAPVLAFGAGQRRPVPVDGYIRNASLRDWEGRTTTVSSPADLNVSCPGIVKAPCYVLTQACAPGQEPADCAALLPDDRNAVYVRVARARAWSSCTRTIPCADGSPDPFARAQGRFAASTKILVQYWFFYVYNDWSAPVAVGDLQEIHAADWESVTVGLSDTEPLWVAYSQHCGGAWSEWSNVPVSPSDRLRPLVAVAKGSQANYRLARATRVPNFAECSGIPKDLLRLVSYAANVRDRTDDAETWSPAPADLKLVTAKTLPMSFPGEWAPFARMQLKNLRTEKRLGKDTAGPATPTYQRLWQTPMQTIFAGRGWKEDRS